MTEFLYAVVDKETGAVQFRKAYVTQGGAKRALKKQIYRNQWDKYAVASVKFEPTITSTLDNDGVWMEVNV